MKKIFFILSSLIFLFSFKEVYSASIGFIQPNKSKDVQGWKLMYLNGEMYFKDYFRNEEWISSSFNETSRSNNISGGITLNTKSYIWHPNFLQLDAGFTYAPGKYTENNIILPDQNDVNTGKKLDLGLTLFSGRNITIGSFARFSESLQNRENLTDVRTQGTDLGASLQLKNKIFPLWVSYQDSKWNQTELATDRSYKTFKKSLQAKVVKSFFVLDRHELNFTHDEYRYDYSSDFLGSKNNSLKNTINMVSLNSKTFFSPVKASNFNSLISYQDQNGFVGFKRFRAYETAMFYLPKNFTSIFGYEYFKMDQETQRMQQHKVSTDFRHQLYESLQTSVFFEYTNLARTYYDEFNYKGGFSLAYTKKIPIDGKLNLTYKYTRYHDDMKSETLVIDILNEEHTLKDAEIILLNKPYINLATVIVKDVTGTIIYQQNFDYTLIPRNNFVEIRRTPGGLIADGSAVYIDYQAIQPGTYNYEANNNSFTASVTLFNDILELYYRRNQQDYVNTQKIEFLTLNYFTEDIIGSRVKISFGEAGVEYNSYISTIVPYKMMRYYIQIQQSIKNKILLSLNGSVRDYKQINNETDQTYIDISSRIAYNFKPETKLSLDLGYRNQIGKNIDLKLVTARCEFNTLLRQLYLTLGVEAYRRDYLSEAINLSGAYIRITRKFNNK